MLKKSTPKKYCLAFIANLLSVVVLLVPDGMVPEVPEELVPEELVPEEPVPEEPQAVFMVMWS